MPTGGEKDITPPKLLRTFPKNNTINFKETSILFEFDENIAVNKWADHFNISPLTEKPIKYKVKNKSLKIELAKYILLLKLLWYIIIHILKMFILM